MKPSFFLITVIIVSVFISGCKEDKTGIVIPEIVAKYPFSTGSEWNYNYSTILSYYDDHGLITRDSVFEEQIVTVKVSDMNDSLPNLPHLIKVETFTQSFPNAKGIIWYRQTDSALYWIAYHNSGGGAWVYPSKDKRGKAVLQNPFLFEFQKIASVDTGYFSRTRQVYAYPFKTGKSWIDQIDYGWRRTKTIISSESISTPNKSTIATFLIQTTDPTFRGLKILDWVSLDLGLVKREIVSDSIAFTGPDSPEPLYWGKMVSRAELINKK